MRRHKKLNVNLKETKFQSRKLTHGDKVSWCRSFRLFLQNSLLHFLFSDLLQIMILFSAYVNENKEMMHVCRFPVFVVLRLLSSPHSKAPRPSKKKQTASLCSHSVNFDWLVIKWPRPLLAVSFTIMFGFNQKPETDVCIKQLRQIPNHQNPDELREKANQDHSGSLIYSPYLESYRRDIQMKEARWKKEKVKSYHYAWHIRQCFCQYIFR